ncbi:hypothetical protein PAPYR_2529 [Paratrimastix pyriformis]|uniref:Uncharacterized protein n=1 Tax=Paratrimastix pyriformis TaxID=342808 RepID=A0ABQ8UPI2_9EUKA|nr:hypothetical protein PAPYR_2529 [Paratrimastix pyriformis]
MIANGHSINVHDPTRWPPELLRILMGPEGTTGSLRLYILLLGISHATRQSLRGTLRKISFDATDLEDSADGDEPAQFDRMPTPTADALAALVGPCKGLVELSLSARRPSLWGCGRTEAVYGPWVDEAFAGHTQLAVLRIPSAEAVMPAMPRILGHLSGLVEFQLDIRPGPSPDALLKILDRHCPRLEDLHLRFLGCHFARGQPPQFFGRLKRLTATGGGLVSDAALQSLTSLEQLHLDQYTPALSHIASHLTHLTLDGNNMLAAVHGLGLTRLESLYLVGVSCADLCCLLADNRATLRSLAARLYGPVGSLFQVLAACSVLTDLDLGLGFCPSGQVNLADLPQSLLDQLQSLRLDPDSGGYRGPYEKSIRIDSATLRRLDLRTVKLAPGTSAALACPVLEVLTLPAAYILANGPACNYPLILRCPRLLRISGLGEQTLTECQPMPHLVQVGYTFGCGIRPSLEALRAGSPRLSRMSGGKLADPQGLVELCQVMPALTHLQATVLISRPECPFDGNDDDDDEPIRIELRLPGHVEFLDLTLTDLEAPRSYVVKAFPIVLAVEAPGLRAFILHDHCFSGVRSLAMRCPALVELGLVEVPALTEFTLDTSHVGPGACGPFLRSLRIFRCRALQVASLLACLGRHGACLSEVAIQETFTSWRDDANWSQLVAALSALPRLIRLELECDRPIDLSLACPVLRSLNVHDTRPRSLVLDCPLLEELRALMATNVERFELAGDPYLRLVDGVLSEEQLKERWPGMLTM